MRDEQGVFKCPSRDAFRERAPQIFGPIVWHLSHTMMFSQSGLYDGATASCTELPKCKGRDKVLDLHKGTRAW